MNIIIVGYDVNLKRKLESYGFNVFFLFLNLIKNKNHFISFVKNINPLKIIWIDENQTFKNIFKISKPGFDNIFESNEQIFIKNKISIVMTYYNRIIQLKRTLDTISETNYNKKLIEVIIYDDRSDIEPCNINLSDYDFNIKIIYGEYNRYPSIINALYAYNNAFKYISGEFVILQNSECLHIGDLISYVINNCKLNHMISFPCWSTANDNISQKLFNSRNNIDKIKNIIDNDWKLQDKYPNKFKGWYNHKTLRPECLHFCNAFRYDFLLKNGIFNRKLKTLCAFDDNEFAERILLNKNFNVTIPEHNYKLFAVHQFHKNKPRHHSDFVISLKKYKKIKEKLNYNFNNKYKVCHFTIFDYTSPL